MSLANDYFKDLCNANSKLGVATYYLKEFFNFAEAMDKQSLTRYDRINLDCLLNSSKKFLEEMETESKENAKRVNEIFAKWEKEKEEA